jgi:hypothetical protein
MVPLFVFRLFQSVRSALDYWKSAISENPSIPIITRIETPAQIRSTVFRFFELNII